MLPVTRSDPEFTIEDIGRDNFLVASLAVLLSNELHQRVVDVCAARQEEAAARTQLVEEEQVLLPPQLAMVSLCSLFLEVLPFLELLGVRERDAVDPLQGLRIALPFPIGGGVLYGEHQASHP